MSLLVIKYQAQSEHKKKSELSTYFNIKLVTGNDENMYSIGNILSYILL